MRAALKDAIRARDKAAMSALRSTLAAIDDAEAVAHNTVDGQPVPAARGAVAKAASGVGATDVPRRVVGPQQVTTIVRAAIAEREAAAAQYADFGHDETAATLRHEARVLRPFADDAAH